MVGGFLCCGVGLLSSMMLRYDRSNIGKRAGRLGGGCVG